MSNSTSGPHDLWALDTVEAATYRSFRAGADLYKTPADPWALDTDQGIDPDEIENETRAAAGDDYGPDRERADEIAYDMNHYDE